MLLDRKKIDLGLFAASQSMFLPPTSYSRKRCGKSIRFVFFFVFFFFLLCQATVNWIIVVCPCQNTPDTQADVGRFLCRAGLLRNGRARGHLQTNCACSVDVRLPRRSECFACCPVASAGRGFQPKAGPTCPQAEPSGREALGRLVPGESEQQPSAWRGEAEVATSSASSSFLGLKQ